MRAGSRWSVIVLHERRIVARVTLTAPQDGRWSCGERFATGSGATRSSSAHRPSAARRAARRPQSDAPVVGRMSTCRPDRGAANLPESLRANRRPAPRPGEGGRSSSSPWRPPAFAGLPILYPSGRPELPSGACGVLRSATRGRPDDAIERSRRRLPGRGSEGHRPRRRAARVLRPRLDGLEQSAGTSAGAIIAAYLACGHTPLETAELLERVPFRKFVDTGSSASSSAGRWNVVAPPRVRHGRVLPALDGRRARAATTFRDLRIDGTGSWCLKLIAADITNRELLVLPDDLRHYRLHPDDDAPIDPDSFKVADAVRMSMSIPFFFEPVTLIAPRHRRAGDDRRRRDRSRTSRCGSSTSTTATRCGRRSGFRLMGGRGVGSGVQRYLRLLGWPAAHGLRPLPHGVRRMGPALHVELDPRPDLRRRRRQRRHDRLRPLRRREDRCSSSRAAAPRASSSRASTSTTTSTRSGGS